MILVGLFRFDPKVSVKNICTFPPKKVCNPLCESLRGSSNFFGISHDFGLDIDPPDTVTCFSRYTITF